MYRSSLKNLSTVYYKELSGCTMLASWRVQGAMLAVPCGRAGGREGGKGGKDPVLAVYAFRPHGRDDSA